jgi:addiction module HigA family antidote
MDCRAPNGARKDNQLSIRVHTDSTAKSNFFEIMMNMHNPPHPGEILTELYMEPLGLNINDFAKTIRVDRKTVSRLINRRTGVTVEMAMRLAKALNTSEKLWLGLQQTYDIWKIRNEHRVDISNIKTIVAKNPNLLPAKKR